MKPRMLCTDCFVTTEPDTVLEGSDLLELLGWCCLAVPGLLYCWWRHALRIKVCPCCGSSELVREARAAQQRGQCQAPRADGPVVHSLCDPLRWPRALATPRDRLRHGGVAALLTALLCANAVVATASTGSVNAATAIASGAAAVLAGWIAYQVVRVSQLRTSLPSYRAWDQYGRPLRIERIF
jgi:hypothetical protein